MPAINPRTVLKVAEIAQAVAPIAVPLAKKAAPVVASAARQALPKAKQAARTALPRAAQAAKTAAPKLGSAAKAAGAAVAGGAASAAAKASAAPRERRHRKAFQETLDSASLVCDLHDFARLWVNPAAEGAWMLDSPGCYAIVSFGEPARKGSPAEVLGVYVASADKLGPAVDAEFSGRGNVDVYADVKYGQRVCAYLYPCPEDSRPKLESALVAVFDAAGSYNRPKEIRVKGKADDQVQ